MSFLPNGCDTVFSVSSCLMFLPRTSLLWYVGRPLVPHSLMHPDAPYHLHNPPLGRNCMVADTTCGTVEPLFDCKAVTKVTVVTGRKKREFCVAQLHDWVFSVHRRVSAAQISWSEVQKQLIYQGTLDIGRGDTTPKLNLVMMSWIPKVMSPPNSHDLTVGRLDVDHPSCH